VIAIDRGAVGVERLELSEEGEHLGESRDLDLERRCVSHTLNECVGYHKLRIFLCVVHLTFRKSDEFSKIAP